MTNTRKYYTIVDRPDLLRDPHSKGLILTDTSVLKREKARQNARNEIETLKSDVSELKSKIDIILELLQKEKQAK